MLPPKENQLPKVSAGPIIDPRLGDAEDDGSSTKRHSMLALAGSLLAEVSFSKLAISWTFLIAIPGLLLGAAPLLASIWIGSVSSRVSGIVTGLWPAVVLVVLGLLGWYGSRPLWRAAESSFWSLNALAVQPGYALCRESLRHLVERMLPSDTTQGRRASVRAYLAAVAGLAVCLIGLSIIALVWPATRWVGNPADLAAPSRLASSAAANAVAIVAGYFAAAGLFWGVADATMPQPRDLDAFDTSVDPTTEVRTWRVAHLSDLHVVGERYGFRIESGRSGPRGNEKVRQVLARLEEIHAEYPLDTILITGDLTDAGRSAEWAEFFDMLAAHPSLADLVVALPGNHDVNVVDRANPARLDLPLSPKKRLRQLRTLSALAELQGTRVRVVDPRTGQLGERLDDCLKPHMDQMRGFADSGSGRRSGALGDLWAGMFPMVLPPARADGLGIILLNSNAETHFSFTNALGIMSAEQARAIEVVAGQFPQACWILALHHHLVEYPDPASALSERIGTALINGSWFVRKLQRLADRTIVMHGHRHVDWIGACGKLLIVSAPSPVMEATDSDDTYFYIHTIAKSGDNRLRLLQPMRIDIGSV